MDEDRCQYGHLLGIGSDPITIREIDPATGRLIKEETLLLRRHVVAGADGQPMTSEFRPGTASVAYEEWVKGLGRALENPIATEGYKRAQAEAEAKAAIIAAKPVAAPAPDDPAWTV
jgi:hypothetical protein